MNRLTVFNISAQFGEAHEVVHSVTLQDASHLVLIDCGYVGFLPQIGQALTESGFSTRGLTHVYTAYQGRGRMDALADLKSRYPGIQVMAGREEAPYISGAKKSLRLTQAETTQEQPPPEQQELGRASYTPLKKVQSVPVDIEAKDGDVLDWCGGCIIPVAPGHTSGHTSLYLQEFQTLTIGDAITLEDDVPVPLDPQYTLDMPRAQESVRRPPGYGARELICYHGGWWISA